MSVPVATPTPTLGWYVHHHGAGHLMRFLAVERHLSSPVTVLSSLPRPPGYAGPWLVLPRDDAADPGSHHDPTAHGRLHWVPIHDPGLRRRHTLISEWIDSARPRRMVVDASAEVALLARLHGVPVSVAAMMGCRTDPGHRLAYDVADQLLAPWPAAAPLPGWDPAWRRKTAFTGGFSRFDGRNAAPPPRARRVLRLWGSGGSDLTADQVTAAEHHTPGWSWTHRPDPAVRADDIWSQLLGTDVVVTHGGSNAVAEVAAARRPAIVVAQQRPHDEQRARAEAVSALGLGTGLAAWPAPHRWADLLAHAVTAADGWQGWSPGDGAARFAAAVESRP